MAEGAMVLETAKLIRDGKSFKKITEILPTYREKIDLFFTIDTLEYLQKGGRIGKVAGTVGELLNIKPIITVANDGTYRTVGMVKPQHFQEQSTFHFREQLFVLAQISDRANSLRNN